MGEKREMKRQDEADIAEGASSDVIGGKIEGI